MQEPANVSSSSSSSSEAISCNANRVSQESLRSLERLSQLLGTDDDTFSGLEDKRLTLTEIEALDMCINELLAFTHGALGSGSICTPAATEGQPPPSLLEQQEVGSIQVGSVHQLVQKIEASSSSETPSPEELRSEVVIASNPEPSDDELTKGMPHFCFSSNPHTSQCVPLLLLA